MKSDISTARKQTTLISISVLIVSAVTIIQYQWSAPEFDSKKLIQQVFRFLLTGLILYSVFQGKVWAKYLCIVLFSLASIASIFALVTIDKGFIAKIPFIVMVLVYSYAAFFFGLSKRFKAFFEDQSNQSLPRS